MNSEKVKEIKKALEVYGKENKGITILRSGEIQAIPYTDILTLINELESENERLKDTVKEILSTIGNMLDDCDSRYKIKDYQWHKNICEKYGVEVEE